MSISGVCILAKSPQAYLLFKTPRFELLTAFYTTINRLISPLNAASAHSLHTNRVVILPSTEIQTGFAFIKEDKKSANEIQDPDNRPVHFFSENNDFLCRSITLQASLITILRSLSIEKTKKFYASYGECLEEQHHNGPKHYSINWSGPFTEIYPERKIHLATTELLFQVADIDSTLQNLKNHNFHIISSSHSQFTIKDPDDRLIKIYQSTTKY